MVSSTFQLPITIHDSERPQKTVTSTLTATIQRNENSPVFDETNLRITINDRYELGQVIKNISASDVDGVSFIDDLSFSRLFVARACVMSLCQLIHVINIISGCNAVRDLWINPSNRVLLYESEYWSHHFEETSHSWRSQQ